MDHDELDPFLLGALAEDLGDAGDITSMHVVPTATKAHGVVVARAAGCVSGLEACLRVFALVDESTTTTQLVEDGTRVTADTPLATVAGAAHSLLAAERLALNILGQMSGVASATQALVDLTEGTGATIVDTRKTVPGMRALQKAAVRHGGGANHRMGLYDAVLIKDNHIAAAGSPAAAVRAARLGVGPRVEVEVEIESVLDLEAVIEAGADIVLLDNMTPAEMAQAVSQAAGRCRLEASGGITRASAREIAETGVDLISVGWLTHSAPALDVALDFETERSADV